MKHVPYPKIGQFRQAIERITSMTHYVGKDEEGKAVFDETLKNPTLYCTGTVKLHGTNAGVSYNFRTGEFWVQSRTRIITPQSDNQNFAFFVYSRKKVFMELFEKIWKNVTPTNGRDIITIYGEWAGKKIQKGVGIAEFDPAFYIFAVRLSEEENLENSQWLSSEHYRNTENKIFNIRDFETFKLEIDFQNPSFSIETLQEMTESVEAHCPVTKALGKDGIGEGIVWTTELKGEIIRWKIKGKKHSATKVKTLAKVDVEKLENVKEFVEYAVTKNRFNQALENVVGDRPLDRHFLGDIIRWVINDILTEEMDTLVKNNLTPKDVNKFISYKTREFFFDYEKTFK